MGGSQDVGTPAEQIGPACQRLLEEALLLQRLSENHLQHPGVARIRHAGNARPPSIDEGLRLACVLVDESLRHRVTLTLPLPAGRSGGRPARVSHGK